MKRGRIPDVQDLISVILLTLFGVMLCVVLGFAVLPYLEPPPLTYLNSPFPVDGPVHQGASIPLRVSRCNNLDQTLYLESARTLRNVDSGRFYSLPSGAGIALPGCSSALVTTSAVPEEAPDGTYVLSAVVRVHGRFGRIFDVAYRSQPFPVVDP